MENIPIQTSRGGQRPRKARSFNDPAKVGLAKLSAHQRAELLNNHYKRKYLLTVPEDILASNPDKYFVYINMNDLQKNGMWHPNGYRLFKCKEDKESVYKEKFDGSFDGYVHRNEMVLAWLPKEEYERRQMEKELVKQVRTNGDSILKDDNLKGFSPHVDSKKENISFEELAQN